jgi:hypothetical protein
VFLSLEDETITPAVFDRYKQAILSEPFVLIYGPLQNLYGVISVKAERVEGGSHNFH